MKKTPTIFDRDWSGDRSRVVDKINPVAQWVFDGQGVATRKYDGTCCLVKDGLLFKRREIKKGQKEPEGFVIADHDDETGKIVGWVPVGEGAEDKWHREGFKTSNPPNGTCELLGPSIQGNPERLECHILLPHDTAETYPGAPRSFNALSAWLSEKDIEGLVFHHPDGRMAKIKLRDFGLKRPA